MASTACIGATVISPHSISLSMGGAMAKDVKETQKTNPKPKKKESPKGEFDYDENAEDDRKGANREEVEDDDEELGIITIAFGDSKIFIFETLKGLVREKARVKEAFEETSPQVVALPISQEALEGLESYVDGNKQRVFLSHYEEIYARNLARFGKVMVPPPSYIEATKLCKERKIDIAAVDMNEAEYTEAFIKNIRTYQYLIHSIRWRLLKRKKFRSRTARDFITDWDNEISKIKGFANLERAREKFIASEIVKLTKKYERILAIVELERSDGIASEILKQKVALKSPKK